MQTFHSVAGTGGREQEACYHISSLLTADKVWPGASRQQWPQPADRGYRETASCHSEVILSKEADIAELTLTSRKYSLLDASKLSKLEIREADPVQVPSTTPPPSTELLVGPTSLCFTNIWRDCVSGPAREKEVSNLSPEHCACWGNRIHSPTAIYQLPSAAPRCFMLFCAHTPHLGNLLYLPQLHFAPALIWDKSGVSRHYKLPALRWSALSSAVRERALNALLND